MSESQRWLEQHLASEPTDGCVEWPFYKLLQGYGLHYFKGTRTPVTHLVLEATGHPRPSAPNDNALHSCDNPPCVNPRHLRWGSNAENVAEKMERGRQVRGSNHGLSKVTEDGVRAIRARYAAGGISLRALAAEFGLSKATVNRIVRRQTWTHVSDLETP